MSTANLHAGGTRSWVSGEGTLDLFRRLVRPGDRTVETGSGASTIVFAECGAVHTAISPASDEHARILSLCAERGIDSSRLELIAESSDLALPRLVLRGDKVDLVFVDGKHAFPMPAVDFNYADRLLKVGGILVMDDAPIRAVAQVCRFMEASGAWERMSMTDLRTIAYRKLAEAPNEDDWRRQPMNSFYPDYWFLNGPQRLFYTTRARASMLKNRMRLGLGR